MLRAVVALVAVALAIGVAWLYGSREPTEPHRAAVGGVGGSPPATRVEPLGTEGRTVDPIPPELWYPHPPGTRIQMAVPFVAHGVRCPDGRCLPLLNDVPEANDIARSPHLGPVPPVVAKIVDDTGVVWYEHADGSTTTTRWCEVLEGEVRKQTVQTLHNAPLPASAGQRLPAAGASATQPVDSR